jgi:MerR family transcriptional regulator, redox-sensitive transcriptional activator SoxR
VPNTPLPPAPLPPAPTPPSTPPATLSVGELAARSGTTVSALHFFEREGLLTSTRTPGNQRRYLRHTLRRVALILVGRRVGIPLADIRDALAALPADRAPTVEEWQRLSDCWRADLDNRVRRLEQLRDDLTGCIGCGCLSLARCTFINPDDTLGREGPGPRTLS